MSMIFHKIKSVGTINDSILIAQFEDGICKMYDVKQLLRSYPVFEKLLENKKLFRSVHIEGSGFGIVWNDEFDLSCNEIWENGSTVPTPFDNLIAFSDATEIWGLNESTLRKAITYGKLKVGFDACNYGKQWVVTRKAMIREYGFPKQEQDVLMAAEKTSEYNPQ